MELTLPLPCHLPASLWKFSRFVVWMKTDVFVSFSLANTNLLRRRRQIYLRNKKFINFTTWYHFPSEKAISSGSGGAAGSFPFISPQGQMQGENLPFWSGRILEKLWHFIWLPRNGDNFMAYFRAHRCLQPCVSLLFECLQVSPNIKLTQLTRTSVGSATLSLVNQVANLRFPAHCRWGELNISPNPASKIPPLYTNHEIWVDQKCHRYSELGEQFAEAVVEGEEGQEGRTEADRRRQCQRPRRRWRRRRGRGWGLRAQKGRKSEVQQILDFHIQSFVKSIPLSFENHNQNVLLPTPKLYYGAIFHPAIPETWQDCFTLICSSPDDDCVWATWHLRQKMATSNLMVMAQEQISAQVE